MYPLSGEEIWARIVEELYTFCAFCIIATVLPALAISFIVVRVSKHLWLKVLTSRYPHLEFIRTDTIRALLDTHRNQGIINVLLCVKGELQIENIEAQLTRHLIERRDKYGDFMFPRLRHKLVSCWGNYAWDASGRLQPVNHILVANGIHRGRPVSESNIQDYVSEIVSKYLPSDQPPWQYIIIPCSTTEPQYYVLVRVHHLLLTGKKSINIGDLLLVEQKKSADLILPSTEFSHQSPLAKLFPKPSAIPELWEKINDLMSNSWNEFVSEYDPVESPRALKSMPGAFHVVALILMSAVNAFREITKKKTCSSSVISQPSFIAKKFLMTFRRECKRRNLTISKILVSPLVTIDPRKWPRRTFSIISSLVRFIVWLPFSVKDEIMALYELKRTGHVRYPGTLTWQYAGLVQLALQAKGEALRAMVQIYRAPMHLWTDTVRTDDGKRHVLQTVSLCGRKVAAWSRPVQRQALERASRALGVSCTDIALYAATEALRTYFEQTNHTLPDNVLATARAATEDFLFTFAEGNGKNYKKSQTGGMICLSLPLGASPRRIASVVEQACNRQGALAAAWTAQMRYGALTRAVPSTFARVALNLLSRRYAVSYTEIDSPPVAQPRKMLWGQTLDSIVYWRPPQANISMSLTVIQYADTVRLAVMSDSILYPGHTIPAVKWPIAIDQLVSKVNKHLARITAHSSHSIPSIVTELLPQETESHEFYESSWTPGLRPPRVEAKSPPVTKRTLSLS